MRLTRDSKVAGFVWFDVETGFMKRWAHPDNLWLPLHLAVSAFTASPCFPGGPGPLLARVTLTSDPHGDSYQFVPEDALL